MHAACLASAAAGPACIQAPAAVPCACPAGNSRRPHPWQATLFLRPAAQRLQQPARQGGRGARAPCLRNPCCLPGDAWCLFHAVEPSASYAGYTAAVQGLFAPRDRQAAPLIRPGTCLQPFWGLCPLLRASPGLPLQDHTQAVSAAEVAEALLHEGTVLEVHALKVGFDRA